MYAINHYYYDHIFNIESIISHHEIIDILMYTYAI